MSDIEHVPAPAVSATPVVHSPQLLIPSTPALDKRTYASTMSYVGITRRTTAWVRKVGGSSPVAAVAAWTAAAIFLAAMYVVLVFWYFVTLVIFGWLMIPFRMIRRSHRKQEHLQQAQLATMQQMMVAQQQAMINNTNNAGR